MLQGELATSPLEQVLELLATERRTGCLHLCADAGEESRVHLRAGQVYAVAVPGLRPALGSRLVSAGVLAPEALAEALAAQQTELQGWRLSELLVHLGYVDQSVVEALVVEQVRDAVTELARWTRGRWRFRAGARTRDDIAPPQPVDALLAGVRERQAAWVELLGVLHGPHAVPHLSAPDEGCEEANLEADAWSLLCKVDGQRSLDELARAGGLTLHEAGRVVVTLVQAGLVEVGAEQPMLEVALAEPEAVEPEAVEPEAVEPEAVEPDALGASIARVSQVLVTALGPRPAGVDMFGEVQRLGLLSRHAVVPVVEEPEPPTEETGRQERRRAAAACELATAHAEAEAEHRARELRGAPHAEVVDLGMRGSAAAAREAAAAARGSSWAEQSDARANAAALLSELSQIADPESVEIEAQTIPEEPARAATLASEQVGSPREGTDTASLLRELSGLGLDDGPGPGVAPAAPPVRPAPAPARKRKGLFGR